MKMKLDVVCNLYMEPLVSRTLRQQDATASEPEKPSAEPLN